MRRIFAIFLISVFILCGTSSAYASLNWVNKTTGTSATSHSWTAIAGSPDGTKLYATAGIGTFPNDDSIWASTDSGVTWTEVSGSVNVGNAALWHSITSSSDGTKVAVAAGDAGGSSADVWVSTDSGATWTNATEGTLAEAAGFTAIASSADGTKIFAGTGGGVIWTSTDSGATWTETLSATGWMVTSIASDSSGTTVVATEVGTGDVWVSTNSGTTWTNKTNGSAPGGSLLSTSAITPDSSKIFVAAGYSLAAGDVGDVWVSDDGGDSWTNLTTGTDAQTLSYSDIAISSDGSQILAGTNGGTQDIWLSTDSGATWANTTTGTSASGGNWLSVYSASDGSLLAATNNASDIWIYNEPVVPTVTTETPSSVGPTSITLNGNITVDGYASSTDRGFNYGLTTSYGTTASTTGTFDTGSFSEAITDLSPGTIYHYRSFATNSAGTGYSSDATFTTSAEVETPAPRITSSGSQSAATRAKTLTPTPLTIADLEKRISELKALIETLLKETPTKPDLSTCPNMSLGYIGSCAKLLQQYLNQNNFLVANTGVGSLGNETTFFGPATRTALIKFQQVKNISPAIGYFGSITRGVVTGK